MSGDRKGRYPAPDQARRDAEGWQEMGGDGLRRPHNPPVVGSIPTRPTVRKLLFTWLY